MLLFFLSFLIIRAMDEYNTNDIIYALATGWQMSALAIIRISGNGCLEKLSTVFSRPTALLHAKNATMVHGYIIKDGEKIDEVVLSVNKEGHGYTKEEAVEINCHGSLAVIQKLMSVCESLGMRAALGGEFTMRSFLSGSIDLTQAEAVQELVASRSQSERSFALGRLGGNIKDRIEALKTALLKVVALVEIQLDYAEDEVDDFTFPREDVVKIKDGIESLASTYGMGRLYGQGAKVVLAGNTNAGKSSLFNLLLKQQRAIVSPVQGTTRDYIEAQTAVQGIPVLLYDTAGLRVSTDEIESEGIRRTRGLMDEADIIIYLIDPQSSNDIDTSLLADARCMKVYSKRDLIPMDGLSLSVKTGDGVKALVDAMYQKLTAGLTNVDETALVIESDRQHKQLVAAAAALEEALQSVDNGLDIVALELNDAMTALGSLTGEITSDDILKQIFSGFCVGK